MLPALGVLGILGILGPVLEIILGVLGFGVGLQVGVGALLVLQQVGEEGIGPEAQAGRVHAPGNGKNGKSWEKEREKIGGNKGENWEKIGEKIGGEKGGKGKIKVKNWGRKGEKEGGKGE